MDKTEEIKQEMQEKKIDINKERIKLMLKTPKKDYKRLGIGLHNGIYYIGTAVEHEGKQYSATVTSTHDIHINWKKYDEIKEVFGLNYRFEIFPDCIDHSWSNKSIYDWLFGKSRKVTIKECFEEIYKLNNEVVYHVEDATHVHVACDIIKNYFFPLFKTNGRTHFQSDFGSGKTRQCDMYKLLTFNPINAGSIKPAMLDRISESTCGTLIVDNLDNMNEEQNKEILQFIEVYYRKGAKNIKGDIKTHKPQAFDGYSPVVINNIIGLPDVTASRCNKELMVRTNNKKITDKKINENDPKWQELRDKLHICALQNYLKVKETYEKLEVKELAARDLERVEGVLTIAKCVSNDVYNALLAHFVKSNQQQSLKELNDNWEFLVYKYLHENINGSSKVKVADITESLAPSLFDEQDRYFKKNKLKFSHYIGKIFRNNKLLTKSASMGYVHYTIKRDDLDKLLEIKGFKQFLEDNTTNNTNTTNTTNNTNTTKSSSVSRVGSVSSVDLPLDIEEHVEPVHQLCKACGKSPCHYYSKSHYFCTELCARQYKEASKSIFG